MSDNSDDTGGERVVFAMLVGVTFGAALGTTVTQGIVAGVVVGTLAALVFPAWTDRLYKTVTDKLGE